MGDVSSKSELKRFFSQEFFHNVIVHWVLIAALAINIADWAVLVFFIRPVDFPIILHYNVYLGVDLIGDWWQVFAFPLIGMLILLINAVLGLFFYIRKERIITYMLLLGAIIVQIAMSIAIAGVVIINY